MTFTENEVRFILGIHEIETATCIRTVLGPANDLRSLGCPTRIFERILEQRAKKLGNKFAEFRAANPISTGTTTPALQAESEKLF